MNHTVRHQRPRRSAAALIGSSMLALSITGIAHAQTQGPASGGGTTPETQAEDLIVTASRIQRSGFTAPTPTTVVDSSNFQTQAAVNVADALTDLPSFRSATNPRASSINQSGAGATFLDLRGLGPSRTLILVDRRRHVASNANNQVDVSLIPTLLIDRTEIVTGGASAAWGSDAVAGVVNLILKKDLVGVRGTAQYGVTSLGDGKNRLFGLAGGFNFADDRGHVLIGGEYSKDDGLGFKARQRREHWIQGRDRVVNPGATGTNSNGQPASIYANNVQYANQYPGGVITGIIGTTAQQTALSGLIGTTFGNNNALGRLTYGQIFRSATGVASTNMIGGSAIGNQFAAQQDLVAMTERYSIMGRVDYKLTDSINFNAEFTRAQNKARTRTASFRDAGLASGTTASATALVARTENPFMPAALRSQLQAAGVSAVYVGRDGYDIDLSTTDPRTTANVRNRVTRGVVGLDGELGVGNFKWDAYYQYGASDQDENRPGNRLIGNYRLATDVVTNPANGQPICRSTLTNPANGCVPFNFFGSNSASDAARTYVTASAELHQRERQHVAAVNLTGDIFNTWAGPVSVATGAEYRQDKAWATVDANSAASRFEFTNSQPFRGKVNVKEVYGELVVPLAKDMSFAKAIDLNLAGRYTDYSTSGGVFTWKAGLTYEIDNQFRLRGTVSRDIRAANIAELYALSTSGGFFNPVDRINGTVTSNNIPTITAANPNLDPERSTTYTVGAVFTPEFVRGFRFSVDYFDIKIKDVISRLNGQQTIDNCANGLSTYCQYITRDAGGFISNVTTPWLNLSSLKTNGVDFELAFARPLSDFAASLPGDFAFRVLATWTAHLIDGSTGIDRAGQLLGSATVLSVPHWTGLGSLTYNVDRFSATMQGRFVGSGNIDNTFKPGTGTSANIYKVPAKTYWTLSASYDILKSDDGKQKLQLFAVADNLFDEHPPFPFVPGSLQSSPYHFDLGRSYRFGARFSY